MLRSKKFRELRVGTFLHPTLFQKREKDGAPTFELIRDERVGRPAGRME